MKKLDQWAREDSWKFAVVLVLLFAVGLLWQPLADKAFGSVPAVQQVHRVQHVKQVDPNICRLDNPERPCNWDYPVMRDHFDRHDKNWYQLSDSYRFPEGHFFDVMHKAYYDATHGKMDQATKDAVAKLRQKVQLYRSGSSKADPQCDTMFSCWWGGFRRNIECIGSVVVQYGCTAASADSPSDQMTDEYMRSITIGTLICGMTSAGTFSEEGNPAVIGGLGTCMAGNWIWAWFG